ncbi:MAG: ECF transporter S component [Clostridiales bacterium]|nr:ECF transporter S component [Clostridiales bacterium]
MAKTSFTVKKISIIAMLCALAYVTMYFLRIPGIGGFLTYDPKDVVITIGGFMLGPLAAAVISVIVSFFEMITVSTTGPYGFVMNVLATFAFACTASVIYRKMHNMKGAVIGLVSGVVAMTVVMILANFFITPLYLISRNAFASSAEARKYVSGQIVVLLLPFNALKAALNATITVIFYKPVVTALRKANLLPPSSSGKAGKFRLPTIITALVILIVCIILIFVMKNAA